MKEPSLEVLDRVRGTILDFLTREDFLPLLTIFLTSQTVQGYGYLGEVVYEKSRDTSKLPSPI